MKKWRRGRTGICSEGKAERITFQICPAIHKILQNFCETNKELKSIIINKAIIYYIDYMQNKEG